MSNFQEKALKHLGLDSTDPNFSITDSDIWDLSNIQAGYDICQKEYEEKLRWIPVEEELPEVGEKITAIGKYGFCSGIVIKESGLSGLIYVKQLYFNALISIHDFTHWRPIEIK